DVSRKRPTTQISEGVFIDGFEGYNIFVEKVNNRTNEIRGVKIYQLNSSARPTTILADWGVFHSSPDGRVVTLELHDGEIHEMPPNDQERVYRRHMFKTHVINIRNARAELERSDSSACGADFRRSAEPRPEPGHDGSDPDAPERSRRARQENQQARRGDPEGILRPRGVYRVRARRRSARDPGPKERDRRGVPLHPLLRVLLPLPGRRGGAGGPALPGSGRRHVDPQRRDRAHRTLSHPPRGRGHPAAETPAPARHEHAPGGRGVRILDRYLLREQILSLLMGLVFFVAIFVVVDIFEKLDSFLDNKVPLPVVVHFYIVSIPGIVTIVLPMSMLLSCLLA